MNIVLSANSQRFLALGGAALLLAGAVLAPEAMLAVMPLLVLLLATLAFYQFPVALVAVLVLTYGFALDIQLDQMTTAGGGGATAVLGAAVVKVVPYVLMAFLMLRYGISRHITWPVVAFGAIAALSIAILPIGRVVSMAEMVRSLIGSVAPFALGLALAPRRIWTAIIRGAMLVPLVSVLGGVLTEVAGYYPILSGIGRLQGLHSPPFLAGFCVTAIFASALEYLRGYRTRWLLLGAVNLLILLGSQARAPFIAVALFLLLILVFSGRQTFSLKRKVDLVMGGMVPALLVLGPALVFALERFTGSSDNLSGRDVIWPYFLDAIESRPLFGFGLGAGKLIVDPEDPQIRLIRSNAAHNEYLRLSVDAGIIGCAAIFVSIIAWIWAGTRQAAPVEKLVLRSALVAALVHSAFDNTLIASTAVMQFSFFAAAMARARIEAGPTGARHRTSRYPAVAGGGR